MGLAGGEPDQPGEVHDAKSAQKLLMLGLLFGLISMLAQSVIAVSSRMLKRVNFATIMFYYGLFSAHIFGFIILGMCVFSKKVPFIYDSWYIYLELFLAGAANVAGLSSILIAYQNANPAIVGFFMYLGVGYNFIADKYLFDIHFSNMQIVGVVIGLFFTLIVATEKMINDPSRATNNDSRRNTDQDDSF